MKPRNKQQKIDLIKAVLAGDNKTVARYLNQPPASYWFVDGKIFIAKSSGDEREISHEKFALMYNPENDFCFFDDQAEFEKFKRSFSGIAFDFSCPNNPEGTLDEIRRIVFYE